MPNIVIIEKEGTLKNMNIKSFVESDLFKKAGFKTPTHFDCHTIWNLEFNKKKYSIELYGKTSGRANQENKYEFPPPVDKLLFFGNCILINRIFEEPLKIKNSTMQNINEEQPLVLVENKINDITVEEWKLIYNELYGGFEDLNDEEDEDDEDEEDEEEIEAAKNNKLTKTGYLDDGFVVEDDDMDDDDDDATEIYDIRKTSRNLKNCKQKKNVTYEDIKLINENKLHM